MWFVVKFREGRSPTTNDYPHVVLVQDTSHCCTHIAPPNGVRVRLRGFGDGGDERIHHRGACRSWCHPGERFQIYPGRRGRHAGTGQAGIQRHVESGRSALDPAQHQMIHRLEGVHSKLTSVPTRWTITLKAVQDETEIRRNTAPSCV